MSGGVSASVPLARADRRARFGSSLAVVAIRLLSIGFGLGYVKAYTGALSTAEVGTFFYLSTLSYVLNALIFVPVDFYMQARLARREELPVAAMRKLVLQVLSLAFAACVVLSAPLLWLDKLRLADIPALYAVAALLYLCTTLRGLLNNRGKTVFASSMLLLEAVGRLAAFLAAAAVLGASARTLMVSSAVALAFELLILLWQVRRQLPLTGGTEVLDTSRAILRTVLPMSGSAICNALQLQTYRVAYPLAGLGAVSGIFGVVSNVGTAGMGACASVFSQLYIPQLYQSAGASIRRYVGHALLLSGGVLVVAMAAAPLLVRLLTKQQYQAYALAIGFGVIVEACNLIIGGYVVLLSIEQRTGLLLKFNVAAALLSVSGCMASIALAPSNPYLIGVSIAGSQLLMTALLIFFARRRSSESAQVS